MLKYNLNVSVGTEHRHYTPSLFAGTLPFYIESFSHYIAYSDYFTERKDVDSYYLAYTLSGQGMLKYRDKEYSIQPGSTFFIDCREYQYYCTTSKEPWEFYYIHLNGTAPKSYFEFMYREGFEVINLKDTTIIETFFSKLFSSEMNFSQEYELLMSQEITNILTYLALGSRNKKNNFNEVITYITENYQSKISIEDLAKISNLSKYHFIRSFKRHYSETPYEFITRYRVNEAKQLLTSTLNSVENIAAQVGFNDVNTFIRAFSKLMHSTPHQYRKSLHK